MAANGEVLSVRKVESRRDLTRFVDLPYRKYAGDPTFVPQIRIGEFDKLNPKKNPFFQHARATLYLAWRGSELVGRIACIDNDNHNATHGENLAFFGFFEAEDASTAAALFRAVEDEARALGRDTLRGPANPSMDDGAGFQIDAFDSKPYVMMPQNPPEYAAFAEASGFHKAKDLFAWMVDIGQGSPARVQRIADRVRKRYDIVVRPADIKNFDRELALLKHIYGVAWEKNWGHVRYTDAEFDRLAADLKLIIDPAIVLFMEYDGKTVGVSVTIPNINQVLSRFNGRLLPTGIFHLLNRKRIINEGRLAILGVLDEYRNRGFDVVLIDETIERGRKAGYIGGECSWVLEDNDAINKGIEAAGAKLYKRYRIYQKGL